MGLDSGYVARTGFLPKDGLIWVDTCGIQFCGRCDKENDRIRNLRAQRISEFYGEFKRRGNIATTQGVLGELQTNVNFYERKKRNLIGWKKENKGASFRRKQSCSSSVESCAELIKAYNQMRNVLGRGVHNEVLSGVLPDDIRKFVGNFKPSYDRKLSGTDKDLVLRALFSGDGSGVLTADVPMMEVYISGAKNFGFKDSFVYNSIEDRVFHLDDWRG